MPAPKTTLARSDGAHLKPSREDLNQQAVWIFTAMAWSYGKSLPREDPFADAQDELTVISWIKDGEKEVIPNDCPKAYGDMILETWQEAEKRPHAERIVMILTLAKPEPTLEISQSSKKYIEKSWHFDPATERKAALAQDDGKPYKLLEATEKDKQRVIGFYQHHPVPGYEIGDVKVIYNRDFNIAFEVQIKRLQQKDKNPAFKPKWDNENNAQWRAETAKKLEELAAYVYRPRLPGSKNNTAVARHQA